MEVIRLGFNNLINIGDNLKRFRKMRGLSQKEVAERLKIPRTTYSNYENNNRIPNEDVLKRISAILSIEVKEILDNSIKITAEVVRHPRNVYKDYLKYEFEHECVMEDFERIEGVYDFSQEEIEKIYSRSRDHLIFLLWEINQDREKSKEE